MCVPCFRIDVTFSTQNADKTNLFQTKQSRRSGRMSSSDYKKHRKLDFPQCAKDALTRIGRSHCKIQCKEIHFFLELEIRNCNCQNQNYVVLENLCTSKKNQERCFELIVECIFLEKKPDGKKSNNVGLSVFEEFQLVLLFAQHFSRPGPEVTRNAVFLCLFGHTSLSPARSRVLSKFISTAISDSIAPVNFPIHSNSNANRLGHTYIR